MEQRPSRGAIRVVIADDHSVVRRGTRQILESGATAIEVVGETGDGREATELVDALLPDVVILDIGMPGLAGVEAARLIKQRHPEIGVLMLTVQDAAEYVWEAVQAGASGYLRKDVGDRELVDAVRTIAAGGAFLDASVTADLFDQLRRVSSDPLRGELTEREHEVLGLVAQGLPNRVIADSLGLSPRTVEVHVGKILHKLAAESRTEAVVLAVRRGLVAIKE